MYLKVDGHPFFSVAVGPADSCRRIRVTRRRYLTGSKWKVGTPKGFQPTADCSVKNRTGCRIKSGKTGYHDL